MGGAIRFFGSSAAASEVTLINSTVTDNEAGFSGGGLFNQQFTLRNTIVAGNSAPSDPDISGSVTSLGTNLIGDTTGASGLGGSDLQNVNPQLGSLQNNGGLTPTHALQDGSPAIDAASSTGCPSTDQRGVARPQDGNLNLLAACDIGAFEVAPPDLALTKSHNGDFRVGTSGTYTLTVRNLGDLATDGPIQVSDTLPSGLTFVAGGGNGWSCAAGPPVLCTNPGPIGAGATSQFTVTVAVAASAAPQVTNVAQVETDFDPNSSNDVARDTTNIAADGGPSSEPARAGADSRPDKAGDDPSKRKESDEDKHQRERTNAGNRGDEGTEGNVISTDCADRPPTLTLVNRDGPVVVELLGDTALQCRKIREGDYVGIDGPKLHEGRHQAYALTIEKPRPVRRR